MMTLAIAAVWPWGIFAEILRSDGQPVNDMVVVATDSRITESNGNIIDDGKKMYRLGDFAGLIFAGPVLAAEDLVESLSKVLSRRKLNYTDFARLLPLHARSAYTSEKRRLQSKKLKAPGPLCLLAPTRDGFGVGRIMVSRSDDRNFRTRISTGIEVIGHPNDIPIYKKSFDEHYQFRLNDGLSFTSDDDVAMTILTDVIAPLQEVIDSPIQSGTVGGRIQCMVITRLGLQLFEMTQPVQPSDAMQQPTLRTVSINPRNVNQYRRREFYRDHAPQAGLMSVNLASGLPDRAEISKMAARTIENAPLPNPQQ